MIGLFSSKLNKKLNKLYSARVHILHFKKYKRTGKKLLTNCIFYCPEKKEVYLNPI